MTTIALDAMGGDHAPYAEVEGALLAARELGVRVLLAGQQHAIREALGRHSWQDLPIEVHHAPEVITMRDSPLQAYKRKKGSSLHLAAKLVREGQADGLVSAGNTGAVMAVAHFTLGTLPSVDRPALAAPFPTSKGKVSVMLDVGANVDSKAVHLEQFAVMGEIYYRVIFGTRRPRVALLSIGEEEMKGNELTREAHNRLKKMPLNFIGNVEGRDVFSGDADVIVCDGFIGNVALKISEGLVEYFIFALKDALNSNLRAKMGALLSRPAFKGFKETLDYSEYGGAPLLGVRGITVIGHGRSNPNAIKNAIRVAAELARARLNEKIEAELAEVQAALHSAAAR
jgi:glycerol-3-phosphate acyltransferase PlsX